MPHSTQTRTRTFGARSFPSDASTMTCRLPPHVVFETLDGARRFPVDTRLREASARHRRLLFFVARVLEK